MLRRELFLAAIAIVSLCYAPNAARAQVTKRPLSDFLQAQGSTTIVFPPVPDYLFFTNAQNDGGSIDYAGIANRLLVSRGLPSPNTTIDGSVSERLLADGLAEVTVTVHVSNALTFVVDANNVPLFGYLVTELLSNPGLKPAIGDALLTVVFKNTPNGPMPDLSCLVSDAVPCPPNFEFLSIHLSAIAGGPLRATFGVPENTPGRATIVQVISGKLPLTSRGFPAQLVNLQVVGK